MQKKIRIERSLTPRAYLEEVRKLLGEKNSRIVGTNGQRVDGIEKVTGQAKYTADHFPHDAPSHWVK